MQIMLFFLILFTQFFSHFILLTTFWAETIFISNFWTKKPAVPQYVTGGSGSSALDCLLTECGATVCSQLFLEEV